MRLVFTPEAEHDLDDIWFQIAQDSLINADSALDKLRNRATQLLAFPKSGPTRPDINEWARSLTEGNYLILYRLTDDTVVIVRIVHGARDLAGLF